HTPPPCCPYPTLFRSMAVAQESLGASRVVKAFGQEERRSKQLVSHYSDSLSAQLKVYVDSAVYNLLVGVVTSIGLAAVLYVGIRDRKSTRLNSSHVSI